MLNGSNEEDYLLRTLNFILWYADRWLTLLLSQSLSQTDIDYLNEYLDAQL